MRRVFGEEVVQEGLWASGKGLYWAPRDRVRARSRRHFEHSDGGKGQKSKILKSMKVAPRMEQ